MTNQSQSQLPDKRLEEGPERIWVDGPLGNSGTAHRIFHEPPPEGGVGSHEYVRASLLQQPTSERCGECCGHDPKFRDKRGECNYAANPDHLPCGHRCVYPATGADEGDAQKSITFTTLIEVLERLRSKNRNPNREWYNGWNAAIDCLIHDAKAAATPPANVGERERCTCDCFSSAHDPDTGECSKCHLFCGAISNREGREILATWAGGEPSSNTIIQGDGSVATFFPAPTTAPASPQDDGWVTFGRVKVDIENETETFERIHPPQPSTTTNEAAVEAARELSAVGYLDRDLFVKISDQRLEKVAAIISKHIPDAGEVERLRKYEREVSTLRVGYALERGLAKNFQKQITTLRAELSNARSNTIREAVDKVKTLFRREGDPSEHRDYNNGVEDSWSIVESLLDKKEGEDA